MNIKRRMNQLRQLQSIIQNTNTCGKVNSKYNSFCIVGNTECDVQQTRQSVVHRRYIKSLS